jgi:hypothetical protein
MDQVALAGVLGSALLILLYFISKDDDDSDYGRFT